MKKLKKREIAEESKEILGWREWVGLPDFEVRGVKAKVDTGARTSAIHVTHVRVIKESKRKWVQFRIHPNQDSRFPQVDCECPLVDERMIKSSTGVVTLRPVIRTKITIGERTWPVEITLVNRDMMGFRMLLGREAIRGKAIVDPARSFVSRFRGKKRTAGLKGITK